MPLAIYIYISLSLSLSLHLLGRTPKGAYCSRGRSRHLLETAFSEPLLRTLLRTHFYCKTHSSPPSQNPSENPFPRTLPRTFSEPFLERCVAVRPLRRAPNLCLSFSLVSSLSISFLLPVDLTISIRTIEVSFSQPDPSSQFHSSGY